MKNFIFDPMFFLYFPLSAPHTPILPTKEFQGKTGLGPYGDFVLQCDWTVGQVMKVLEKNNMFENTLFIFTSDNGCSPMANFDYLEKGIEVLLLFIMIWVKLIN